MNKRHIEIPKAAAWILSVLTGAGYEAYVVGGCVRDSLLGREPEDWDITTSATPQQVKALFRRTIDTGIIHGTVTVMVDRVGYEITTYRIDGEYEDGRHPKSVQFTNQLTEDLRRRDFTINAMAYHPEVGVVDKFDGMGDLERGIIRCVGVAGERFDEDALRILRAVRFSAQLGFEIEAGTRQAIAERVTQLAHISAERIRMELVKLLNSPNPEHIRIACDLGITAIVLPEYDKMRGKSESCRENDNDSGEEHILKELSLVATKTVLRFAALMQSFENSDAVLRRLKFDNFTRERVVGLIRWHDLYDEATERNVRRELNLVGAEVFEDFLALQRADILAGNPDLIEERLEEHNQKKVLWQKIIAEGQCFTTKDLKITGRELMAVGVSQGPLLGKILKELTQAVIDEPSLNEKEKLLTLAKEKIGV